jgi:L-ascorbate metabolism protein UlaG (beta-lactamase superfamily)
MKIHHLRNATFIIEVGKCHILIDPMLSEKGKLPPFAWFRHKPERNPIVLLPDNAPDILGKVTHCLITHSQKFGIKALQHTDHLDPAGGCFLLMALERSRDHDDMPVWNHARNVPSVLHP